MYQEIEKINSVPFASARLDLFLDFLAEYAGWQTHLENIGASWGADVSNDRVAAELQKVREHIEKLKAEIRNLK